ncbi:GMC oxidoreductase [Nocardiopsis sp. NPDC050513]|uniref:GMC oxidoreductase n=1 Tax=Nocardiopsis sp. NPDC050513 TaxID=3364338 RepID=UPI00378F8B63
MTVAGRHSNGQRYDAIVVGSGVTGSLTAKRLGERGWRVLVLEAGTGRLGTWEGYTAAVNGFRTATRKGPNSPYLPNPAAPSPDSAEPLDYFVQKPGGQMYASDYLRVLGGTMLHWEGETPRMLRSDFDVKPSSDKDEARSWPLGPCADANGRTTDFLTDLAAYYDQAERELGVAGDTARVWEPHQKDSMYQAAHRFPMLPIPQSHLDDVLAKTLKDKRVTEIHLDGKGKVVEAKGSGTTAHSLALTPIPQARNSNPNPDYDGGRPYRPRDAVGLPNYGERCVGNSSCIPICPVQAKYTPLRTHREFDPDLVTVATHSVVTRVLVNRDGRATGVEYKVYDDPRSPSATKHRAEADIVVLAAYAVENAKIMLMSQIQNDQIGRNLTDHPLVILHGLAPEGSPLGPFRGPPLTSTFDSFRNGAWRGHAAAFRVGVHNWGWGHLGEAPGRAVRELVGRGHLTGEVGRTPPTGAKPLFGTALREALADHLPRQVEFMLMLEQTARKENRVELDWHNLDNLGIPRPKITYTIDDYVKRGVANSVGVGLKLFERLGVTEWHFTEGRDHTEGPITEVEVEVGNGVTRRYPVYGARHSGGTHIMGTDRETSVVDAYQRSWDVPNLYAVGTGSMPSQGVANPALTAAALTLRTADEINRVLLRTKRPRVGAEEPYDRSGRALSGKGNG